MTQGIAQAGHTHPHARIVQARFGQIPLQSQGCHISACVQQLHSGKLNLADSHADMLRLQV